MSTFAFSQRLAENRPSSDSDDSESPSPQLTVIGSPSRADSPPGLEASASGELNLSTAPNPRSVSAREMHSWLVTTFRVGNRIRREYIETLQQVYEQRLFIKSGSPSITQYVEKYFRSKHSETYEFLRVARALRTLTKIGQAFDRGQICWSALKQITRIADEETEEIWLEFAKLHSVTRIKAEVRHAIRKKRAKPRDGRYGLPNLEVRVSHTLSPEEHDIYEKAIHKLCAELGQSLGRKTRSGEVIPVEPKEALLFMCRRMLETEPQETPPERRERDDSLYTILYHRCYDCRKAALITPEGPVEVDGEIVDRVEGEAMTVSTESDERPEMARAEDAENKASPEKDKPNNYSLTRKVNLRDGAICSNPFCRRRLGHHAHHIVFRSKGGKSELANETLLCRGCHALLHDGLLKIEGHPDEGLCFTSAADDIRVDMADELKLLSSLDLDENFTPAPPIPPVADSACAENAEGARAESARAENPEEARAESARAENPEEARAESARAEKVEGTASLDSERTPERIRGMIISAASGLRRLDWPQKEAMERTEKAYAEFLKCHGRHPTIEELCLQAIRGYCVCEKCRKGRPRRNALKP